MYALTLAAATAEPMSAVMASGWFRNLLTMLLIAVAVLALFAPTLLAKIKTNLATMITEQLRNVLPQELEGRLQTPGQGVPAVEYAATTPSEIVKQRAAALKSACPQSDPALRLKWLELGYGPEDAKTAYIAVLETQVKAEQNKAPEISV